MSSVNSLLFINNETLHMMQTYLFNASRSIYYQPMLDAIASFGPGFKGPGYEDIRGPLLKNEVERVQEYLIEFKNSWTKAGCTIMSDG